jgi:hypothetical protein
VSLGGYAGGLEVIDEQLPNHGLAGLSEGMLQAFQQLCEFSRPDIKPAVTEITPAT